MSRIVPVNEAYTVSLQDHIIYSPIVMKWILYVSDRFFDLFS